MGEVAGVDIEIIDNDEGIVLHSLDDLPDVEERTLVLPPYPGKLEGKLKEGDEAYLWPNKYVRNQGGQILTASPDTAITRSNASEKGKKGARFRHERTKELAREEITEIVRLKAKKDDVSIVFNSASEAYAYAVGQIFKDILNKQGDLNQRRLALGWVGTVTDVIPSPKAQVVTGGNGTAAEHLSPEAWQLLDRVIRRMGEILDQEVIDDPIITTDKGTNHELSDGEVIDV